MHAVDSVHAEACRLAFASDPKKRWLSEFLLRSSVAEKVSMLFQNDIDRDTKSLAVIQMLNRESKPRSAVFAFTTYPLLHAISLLNEEALNELAGMAKGIMNIDGVMEWREGRKESNTVHPGWSACLHVLDGLPTGDGNRKSRARQLFLYLLTQSVEIAEPMQLESDLQQCFLRAREHAGRLIKSKENE